MNPVEPTESDLDALSAVIGRELAQLPRPCASRSLMPRVMAAVATSRPAPRTWFTWPLEWQVLSIAALAVLVAGAVWSWPIAHTAMTTALAALWGKAGAVTSWIAPATARVQGVVSVIGSVWRGLLQPVVGGVFLILVILCAICAAFGAALGRVALGGASQS